MGKNNARALKSGPKGRHTQKIKHTLKHVPPPTSVCYRHPSSKSSTNTSLGNKCTASLQKLREILEFLQMKDHKVYFKNTIDALKIEMREHLGYKTDGDNIGNDGNPTVVSNSPESDSVNKASITAGSSSSSSSSSNSSSSSSSSSSSGNSSSCNSSESSSENEEKRTSKSPHKSKRTSSTHNTNSSDGSDSCSVVSYDEDAKERKNSTSLPHSKGTTSRHESSCTGENDISIHSVSNKVNSKSLGQSKEDPFGKITEKTHSNGREVHTSSSSDSDSDNSTLSDCDSKDLSFSESQFHETISSSRAKELDEVVKRLVQSSSSSSDSSDSSVNPKEKEICPNQKRKQEILSSSSSSSSDSDGSNKDSTSSSSSLSSQSDSSDSENENESQRPTKRQKLGIFNISTKKEDDLNTANLKKLPETSTPIGNNTDTGESDVSDTEVSDVSDASTDESSDDTDEGGDADTNEGSSTSSSNSSSSSSSSDVEVHVRRRKEDAMKRASEAAAAAAAWVPTPKKVDTIDIRTEKGTDGAQALSTGKPFKRVDDQYWGKKAENDGGAFADNSYGKAFGESGFGATASSKLIQVRGKRFQHEKTKAKRTYNGFARNGKGITMESNSTKFFD